MSFGNRDRSPARYGYGQGNPSNLGNNDDSSHQHQGWYSRSGNQYDVDFNSMATSRPKSEANVGATFYPGGMDSYAMPELMSPAPKRVMPEVPSNMQNDLAYLELEDTGILNRDRRTESLSSETSMLTPHGDQKPRGLVLDRGLASTQQEASSPRGYTADYEHTNASAYQNVYSDTSSQATGPQSYHPNAPNHAISPFPKVINAGSNVPPSDEEKEEVLERARPLVLSSDQAEMQLAWAQDALLWVESAASSRARLPDEQQSRSSTPTVEHQLRVDAVSIVNFLADQGHPKALFLKGTWHEFGKFGCVQDRRAAFASYRSAAEKSYARAEYRMGLLYEAMQDMRRAIKHYTSGVALRDSASNYRLGMMILLGQYEHLQDYRIGMERIKFSADNADENAPQGAYVYGMLLARELPEISVPEEYLPVDIDLAKQYIEKAAYLGFAKAQQKMGSAYELCLWGCDFNPALSLHYNALAARQGEPEANMAISKWFLCGYEGIFDKNEQLAFIYAERAAQDGLATAEFAMGYFYEIGMYVPMDIAKAQEWYQKAASHGNKDGVGRLNGISQKKTLNKKDHEEIAISRIRSQYGSKRGARPDRFKDKPVPLPSMAEDVANTHNRQEHSRNLSEGARISAPNVGYTVARPKSVAPYPEDDTHFGGHSQPRLSPNLDPAWRPIAGGPPADRPGSAFGIRPLSMGQRSEQDYTTQVRLSSSMGNLGIEGGVNNPPRHSRVASAGWEPQQLGPRRESPNRLPQPQGGYQTSPDNNQRGRNVLHKGPPGMHNQQQQPLPSQKVPDLAYHAPPVDEYRGKPLPSPSNQPRYDSLPQDRNSGYGRAPSPNYGPAASPSNGGSASPGRYDARQSLPQGGNRTSSTPAQAHQNLQQRPVSTAGSAQTIPLRGSSAAPSTSSRTSVASAQSAPAPFTSTSKPAKEGPKTFDEMGISHAKNESDCSVM